MSDNGTELKNRKLAIICSKGTLDMAYPGLILANAALMEGADVMLFFTFWGLDIIQKKKMDHLMATPLGNPSMGMPNMVGMLPGMTAMASTMMRGEIAKLDFPPVSEFLEDLSDAGAEMYGCRMAMDMMKLDKDDLFEGINDVIGAMEFIEMTEGAQIIFI